jgi:hypothetical protein
MRGVSFSWSDLALTPFAGSTAQRCRLGTYVVGRRQSRRLPIGPTALLSVALGQRSRRILNFVSDDG